MESVVQIERFASQVNRSEEKNAAKAAAAAALEAQQKKVASIMSTDGVFALFELCTHVRI